MSLTKLTYTWLSHRGSLLNWATCCGYQFFCLNICHFNVHWSLSIGLTSLFASNQLLGQTSSRRFNIICILGFKITYLNDFIIIKTTWLLELVQLNWQRKIELFIIKSWWNPSNEPMNIIYIHQQTLQQTWVQVVPHATNPIKIIIINRPNNFKGITNAFYMILLLV